jgi:hypothetical protein
MHQEGTMTAQRGTVARRTDPEPEPSGWPGVVRHAIDSWPCTVRLCVVVLVAGVVLAALIVLRLWV